MNSSTRRRLLQALGAATASWPLRGIATTGPPSRGIAADFDPVSAVWLGHAAGHAAMTRGLVAALTPYARVRFLVPDRDEAESVRGLYPGVDVLVEPLASFFVRDVAVFTREAGGVSGVVDVLASQYGAAVWCQRRYAEAADVAPCVAHARALAAAHDGVDRALAARLGLRLHRTPLALEGGGVEVNGRGLMITNEELHRSRNPQWSRLEVERELLRLPGVRKVLWVPGGLAEDVLLRGSVVGPYVAWGTGGHTDQFVRFVDERTVLLAWPDDADVAEHPVARATRERMQRCFAALSPATDQRGRSLRVIKVPMPRIVQRRVFISEPGDRELSEQWSADHFPAHERRRPGDALWQVATASYLNFVVANGAVVLPDFVPYGTSVERQERVRRLFMRWLPGRQVDFVDAITAHWVGGGLHCATLNQP